MANQYLELKRIISCDTNIFDAVFPDIYTPREIELVENAAPRFNKDEAAAIWKIAPESAAELLEAGYRSGVFSKYPEEESLRYGATEMYYLLDIFVLADPERWNSYPAKFTKDADDWYFGEYCKRVEQRMLTEDEKPSEIVLPLEDALEYVDALQHDLYLMPCDCRSICGNCGHEKYVCIQSFEITVNSIIDRGYGQRISKEEAKEIVRRSDDEGLIHSPTNCHFCNCCTDCCYPFRYSKIRGSRRQWPKSFYTAEIELDKCIGCGLCVKRCPVEAIAICDKKAAVDGAECVGCGVCRVPCPKDAIYMREVVAYKRQSHKK